MVFYQKQPKKVEMWIYRFFNSEIRAPWLIQSASGGPIRAIIYPRREKYTPIKWVTLVTLRISAHK